MGAVKLEKKPVERTESKESISMMIKTLEECAEIALKSSNKIEVFVRLFRALSYEDGDKISYYMGVEEILEKIANDLGGVSLGIGDQVREIEHMI